VSDFLKRSEVVSSIQILRALAALFIVIGHGQGAAQDLAMLSGRTFAKWSPVPWGVGVDLFFVISGFIIYYASERYEGVPRAKRSFIAHRIARVVPLYWLCTCLFLGLIVLKKSVGFAQYDELPSQLEVLCSLLFFPFSSRALPDGLAFPAYNLGWTLNYEMYFYVLFALCLAQSRSQSALRIFSILFSIAVLGLVFEPSLLPFSFWCQPIILEFGTGILIAVAFRQGVTLVLPIRLAIIATGILLLLFLPFGQPGEFEGTTFNDLDRFFTLGIPAALVVAGAALGPDIENKTWFSLPIMIGNASYSLYLVHPFVIFVLATLFRRSGLFRYLPLPCFVGLTIVLAPIVALISYRFFERPSARMLSAWLAPKQPKGALDPSISLSGGPSRRA
jgi:exopolysaccharide production protein ExoZ